MMIEMVGIRYCMARYRIYVHRLITGSQMGCVGCSTVGLS